MKKVFDNDQVAHVWAQHSQSEGRSSNGNFWFKDTAIYSYRTMIARLVFSPINGRAAYLVTSRKYSMTTSRKYSMTTSGKHIPAIYRAISGQYFNVDDVGACDAKSHGENVNVMLKEYEGLLLKLSRAKSNGEFIEAQARALHVSAIKYAEFFGLEYPDFPVIKQETLDAMKDRAAKDSKRKAEETKKRKAAQALEQLERLEKWRDNVEYVYFRTNRGDKTYMRVNGDNIETSQGAAFPVEHAKKAFMRVLACRNSAMTWNSEEQGKTIALGHFKIDHVDTAGNVKAGCHFVEWDEIERIARQLKIFP